MNAKIVCLLACALGSAAAPTVSAAAAERPAAARPAYQAPHNAFGQPDFTGVWSNTMTTRMERPANLGDRLVFTPAEVKAIEQEREAMRKSGDEPTPQEATITDLVKTCNIPGVPAGGPDCGVNTAFIDAGERVGRVNGQPRTSLITFPANGNIPFKPGKGLRPNFWEEGNRDNPENRGLTDRCLVGNNISTGAIMGPTLYNNNFLFQQSDNTVAIVIEMSHDARMVRLNVRHDTQPKWLGDSVGHWEGDTLVVDTINFHPEQLAFNSPQLHLIERFTRVGAERMLYQFRVEDPEVYSQPWGGEMELRPTKGLQYEYACHEGNHALSGILAGARAEEQEQKQNRAAVSTSGRQ